MLTIHNLSIQYGSEPVVRNVSFHVPHGEILVLIGPTGCGKSSVLRAVAGLMRPLKGEIIIDGLCTSRDPFIPPEKRRTGLVFQDFALFPHLNVEENIGFRVKDRSQVERWLGVLDLHPVRKAMPETLSGGQKQRVALARSLAHQPKLLLLDEPLSSLDTAMKTDLRRQIRNAIRDAGVTSVWVTHDQTEAMSAGDLIGVMRDGCLEQVGAPETCYETPANRFVANFFGEGNLLRGEVRAQEGATALGRHPVHLQENKTLRGTSSMPADVLVRPHDLGLSEETPGNAVVERQVYEGESRSFQLRLDSGERIQARLGHEDRFAPGARVRAWVRAAHPLVAFPRM